MLMQMRPMGPWSLLNPLVASALIAGIVICTVIILIGAIGAARRPIAPVGI